MSSLERDAARRPGASVECDDDPERVQRAPVREAAGATACRSCRRPPSASSACSRTATADLDEPVAKIAPRYGEATPLRLAANAVMAGCRPEYFPLVLLAIEAMAEEPFNLYGIQATTHPCTPLLIVNGPVAKEVDINCGPQRDGQRLARQRDDRPRDAARARQHRRGDPGHRRHGDVRHAGEVHLLRRRERGGEPVGAAARRARASRARRAR